MKRLWPALALAVFLPTCDGGDGDDDGGGGEACWADEPGELNDDTMQTWGAPCTSDADCAPLLGDDGICAKEAVIFGLPGGYCTKRCSLPDTATTVIQDDPACDSGGGIDCVGAMGIFERCAKPCSSNAECGREGYFCRQMPQIAMPEDPSYCLMSDCCEDACGLGE